MALGAGAADHALVGRQFRKQAVTTALHGVRATKPRGRELLARIEWRGARDVHYGATARERNPNRVPVNEGASGW